MIAIHTEQIHKSFGAVKAVEDINLQIEQGELFAIIGPDGAGKTTLFRILVTLMLPDQGVARVMGLDVRKDYREIRSQLGYMPGRFSLYHDLSVQENLSFYARVFGTDLKEHYHLIADIYHQLEPFRHRPAGKLSGGMKQKLALSCALIHKPSVLVLDEPTTGVDAVSRLEFWNILDRLKLEGITILVSTPYMDEAMRCGRVALMQNGSILEVNTPQSIVENYSKDLMSVTGGDMFGILLALRQMPDIQEAYRYGQEIHLSVKKESILPADIIGSLSAQGFQHVKIVTAKPSIEDCFMDLMKA